MIQNQKKNCIHPDQSLEFLPMGLLVPTVAIVQIMVAFFWVTHCAAKVHSKASEGNTGFTCKVNETGEGGCRSNWKQRVGHKGPDLPKFHSNPPI